MRTHSFVRCALPLLALAATATPAPAADALVYRPLTPCRIIDTRLAGGAFAAGEQRSYVLRDPARDYGPYGGNAEGCNIPAAHLVFGNSSYGNLARALVLNFVAVGAEGPGHLTAWALPDPAPLASVLNYAAVPGLNIANGVVVPTCDRSANAAQDVCPTGDLTIQAAVSPVHVVVDVMGYYEPAGSALDFRTHGEYDVDVPLADGLCHEIESLDLLVPAPGPGTFILTGSVTVNFDHVNGVGDKVACWVEEEAVGAAGSCDAGSRDAAGVWEWPAALPSFTDQDLVLSFSGYSTWALVSGRKTFYLNCRAFGAGTAGEKVQVSGTSNTTSFSVLWIPR